MRAFMALSWCAIVVLLHPQQTNKEPAKLARVNINAASTLNQDTPYHGPALLALAKLAEAEHVPLSVFTDLSRPNSLCTTQLDLPAEVRITDLVRYLDRTLPEYTLLANHGFLSLRPRHPPVEAEQLLKLNIPHFATRPESMIMVGQDLWTTLKGTLSPGQGTSFAGAVARDPVILDTYEETDRSLNYLLDELIRKGEGGMWVLESALVSTPMLQISRPFAIYSYDDDQLLGRILEQCPQARAPTF